MSTTKKTQIMGPASQIVVTASLTLPKASDAKKLPKSAVLPGGTTTSTGSRKTDQEKKK